MGTLYRKFCPTCDSNAETDVTFDGFAGATITDSRCGGEIISEGYLAYILDSGELVPLPHPIESSALEAAGGTWTDAAIHGRLLYIHNLICKDCGTQNTTVSLYTGGIGCVTGLGFGVFALACNVFVLNFHLLIETLFVWIAIFIPSLIIDLCVRIRYSDNLVSYKSTHCTQCGSNRSVSLASAAKETIPCPQCVQKTLTIEIAGFS